MAQRENHIKRPMNCFMVWSREKRCEILKKNPGINNALISKMLGEAWRKLSEKEKKPYVKEAKRLTAKLLEDHPDYKYRPRRRKSKIPESRKQPPHKPEHSQLNEVQFSPSAIHPSPYSMPAMQPQVLHPMDVAHQGIWTNYTNYPKAIPLEAEPPTPTYCLSPSERCNPLRTAFAIPSLPYGYHVCDQEMMASPYYFNWRNPRSAWLQNTM